jgi:general nucleoside transport system ATP-binding protein
MQLSDRIIVLLEGAVMGELRRDEFDVNTIGLLMSGVTEATASGSRASKSTAP